MGGLAGRREQILRSNVRYDLSRHLFFRHLFFPNPRISRLRIRSALLIFIVGCVVQSAAMCCVAAADDFIAVYQKEIAPILRERCGKCHGAAKQESDINLSAIANGKEAARQRKLWRKAVAQIEAGEMPPADEPQLTADERGRLILWMKRTIEFIDCDDPANRDPGAPFARRLSLAEYNHTIRDLLGFEYDASAVGMSEESGEGNRFGNLATALDIPPVLMEKYFAAADQILDRFFGTELSSTVDGRIREQARISRESMFGLNPGQWRQPDYEVAPPQDVVPREAARALITPLMRRAYRGQATDVDVNRILVLFDLATRQEKSYGDAIRLMLKAILVSPKFLFRVEADRQDRGHGEVFPVGDHELAVRLSYFLWSSTPDEELLDLADRGRLTSPGPSTESVKFAGTAIAGPGSESHQGNNYERVFDGDLLTNLDGPDASSYWVGLDLGEAMPIRQIRFAGRIGLEQRMVGGKFQGSNSADFSAKDVVELLEVTAVPARGWVSHNLSSTNALRYVRYLPPENAYGNIAELEVRGPSTGTVLEQQVRRMLADPRAGTLTETFATRWLQIDKLPTARPSTEFFPEFNANVRQAMYEETTFFFDALRREDRSVLELLDADFTFVNEDLARHYGLSGATGKELQRVSLKPENHRGGLLGMGSILALTSHTSRTSPTLRGKWILDVLLGSPPPPPPANVSQIAETNDKQEIQTFRQKLKQHAEQAACAACHRKMDPLGFALDNYNAVGQWREKHGDQVLDVSGELPSGEKLNGVIDLKRVLLARKSEFTRNLAEQMLTYAL
ncbi:MAG: hypothetical protein ACI9HK_002049, partial [Pirellulaceae bacterium]